MSRFNFKNKKLDDLHLHFVPFPVKPRKGLRIVRSGHSNELWAMCEGPVGPGSNTVYTSNSRLGRNCFYSRSHAGEAIYSDILDMLKKFGIISDAERRELSQVNQRVKFCEKLIYNSNEVLEHASKTGIKFTKTQLKKLNKQIADAEAELKLLTEQDNQL